MREKQWEKELRDCENLRIKVEEELAQAPEGKMWCSISKGKYPEFYYVDTRTDGKDSRGIYMGKDKADLIAKLAQKEYDKKLIEILRQKERCIKAMIRNDEYDLRDAYLSLPEAKRKFVAPYILSDEEYLKKWLQTHPASQNSFPIVDEYPTEKGEVVRSKSEKMIADKLFYRKVTYVYEATLVLSNGKVIYPDFTVLNQRTRKTYYLEHLGMMDDEVYCKKNLEKLDEYEKSKIYLGEKLLISMESNRKPINMKQIDGFIDRYFM